MRSPLAALLLALAACGGSSRFALRSPVWRDGDDRPLARAPAKDEESDFSNTIDETLLRPLSHAFLFEQVGEAHNVNSLDEVPDSSWYTNRHPTAEEIARGPCGAAADPVLPLTVTSSKLGGTTPGFVATDARGQKYVIKLDELTRFDQPEISTAADAIVSRLYWAVGYNAPCNEVIYVHDEDLHLGAGATVTTKTGKKKPLTLAALRDDLALATRNHQDLHRLGVSRFIEGQNVGTWRTEGTRSDDANDVIPHEDRRDLRGEYFLAGWVKHWDSRGPNSFDAFVPSPRGGGGYVVHYFLDFSDSLGGTSVRTEWREWRLGYESVFDFSTIMADMLTFGVARRPWDDVAIDWMYPNLGTLDVEHFDPMGFAPQTPLVRWQRAQPADLAWMARRIAGIDRERLAAAVHAGKLSRPLEEARLVEVLWGRREKILRTSFARVSPLAQLSVSDGDRLCAVDLGLETGISSPRDVSHRAAFRGARVDVTREPARICVRLPHFAATGMRARDDAAERYATIDLVRTDAGRETTLRAHLYDLGPSRGYFLAGIERL